MYWNMQKYIFHSRMQNKRPTFWAYFRLVGIKNDGWQVSCMASRPSFPIKAASLMCVVLCC